MGIGPPGRCRSRTPWVWGCNWPTASTPHSAGILHRDINPANIFITDRGTAKLLDFGLARAQGAELDDAPTMDVTAAGTVMGTVAYMSPEQARGEQLDARSDLFSLGVVLYEMLTGRPAFTGNTSAVIFERIFNETLEPPPRLNPGVPRELDRVVRGLLEKSRDRRTSSASDVRASFARVRHDSGSRAAAVANDEKSILVLPFVNLSADPDNEYFSDGLTDEIVTDLSQIGGLRVISRGSSMQLKGQSQDVRAVASELNVRYVLEGSVRKAGNAVRVTAQLVDPESSRQLWAEKYSGRLEDIFEIQEQISRKIVDALKMRLSPEEGAPTFAGQACRFLRLALEGQRDAARASFDSSLLDRARNVEFWSYWVSECHALIDERDLAIEWLDTAFRKGFWNYPYVSTHSSIFRRLPLRQAPGLDEDRLGTVRALIPGPILALESLTACR
jgi:TolB-like protein